MNEENEYKCLHNIITDNKKRIYFFIRVWFTIKVQKKPLKIDLNRLFSETK